MRGGNEDMVKTKFQIQVHLAGSKNKRLSRTCTDRVPMHGAHQTQAPLHREPYPAALQGEVKVEGHKREQCSDINEAAQEGGAQKRTVRD